MGPAAESQRSMNVDNIDDPRNIMSPTVSRLIFIAACLVVPITWGIAVNWLFGRLAKSNSSLNEQEHETQDEPVIEYYI